MSANTFAPDGTYMGLGSPTKSPYLRSITLTGGWDNLPGVEVETAALNLREGATADAVIRVTGKTNEADEVSVPRSTGIQLINLGRQYLSAYQVKGTAGDVLEIRATLSA